MEKIGNDISMKVGLPWHIVEEAINREIEWLKTVFGETTISTFPSCDECQHTFRKIALLIIMGKVKAKEFIAKSGNDLWDGLTLKQGITGLSWHGGEWHRKMMSAIREYFEFRGFEVIDEPFLSKGRADLGIYKDGYPDLFIEIGTTSAHKLWWNLQMLKGYKILLILDENRSLEFSSCHNQDQMEEN